MSSPFQENIKQFSDKLPPKILKGMKRGIEKESLRITPEGEIAQTPHPKKLGSKLTHPYITTDYSEALLELITPPVNTPEQAIDCLMDLHTFTYQQIGDELLWTDSMPCSLIKEADIPIANYGSSNVGRLKYIYREGLAHRYGKSMQVIAGIHLNVSFPTEFWEFYQSYLKNTQPLQDFINDQYFHLIRNYWRYCWLLISLFGASPAICQSFLRAPNAELQELTPGTWCAPEGTSLRMSDLGYQNSRQHDIDISLNNLSEYLRDLKKAVSTPEPDYEKFGTIAEGKFEQLNSNLLQMEAEYYSPIRPKRRPGANERSIHALCARGIEYVEVRVLDINPYDPVGITTEEIRFIESFLMMCLLSPSPAFQENDLKEVKANMRLAVYHGQNDETTFSRQGKKVSLGEWSRDLFEDIQSCATLLDKHHQQELYQGAVGAVEKKRLHQKKTLAGQILQDMKNYHNNSFVQFAYYWSQQHQNTFLKRKLSPETEAELVALAKKSLQEQKKIEKSDTLSLMEYAAQYLSF